MRDNAKVFVLIHSLLTHLSLDRQTVDGRWLEVYELTAWNLINYGKIKEAVSLVEQVVKIREQTLAEDHPDRLASQHVLAGAYRVNGQVKEAVSLLEQVVKIQEQTLAEDHPDQLASQHDEFRGETHPARPSIAARSRVSQERILLLLAKLPARPAPSKLVITPRTS